MSADLTPEARAALRTAAYERRLTASERPLVVRLADELDEDSYATAAAVIRELARLTFEATSDAEPGPYTRAQLAAAVDEAHAALHDLDAQLEDQRAGSRTPGEAWTVSDWILAGIQQHATRAHEALHRVGAGQPRVACANGERDPEAQRLIDDLGRRLADLHDQRISCGHTVADLIGGTDPGTGRKLVTKCGACLAERSEAPPYEEPATPRDRMEALLGKAEEFETRARACRIQAAAIVGAS